jgi:hypothetical protein
MYDRALDDPRLSRWLAAEAGPPHPVPHTVGSELTQCYDHPLGRLGLNYYRDGRDSGACQARWEHGVPKVARAGARVSVSWRWSAGSGSPGTTDARRA